MSLMRTYRAALTLSQSAFAARLNVPLETYRTWDSGRREPSKEFLSRARTRRWCTDPAPSVSHDRPPGHRGDSRCMIST